jgi:hypothetical protein
MSRNQNSENLYTDEQFPVRYYRALESVSVHAHHGHLVAPGNGGDPARVVAEIIQTEKHRARPILVGSEGYRRLSTTGLTETGDAQRTVYGCNELTELGRALLPICRFLE